MPDALRLPRADDDEPEPHPRAPTPHTHSVREYLHSVREYLGPASRCRVPGCRGPVDAAGRCIGAASALGEITAVAMRHAAKREQSRSSSPSEPPWPPPKWRAVEPQPAALEVGMHVAGVRSAGIGEVVVVDDDGAVAVRWASGAVGSYAAETTDAQGRRQGGWRRYVTVLELRPEGQ